MFIFTSYIRKFTFRLNNFKELRWQHCMNPWDQVKLPYPEKIGDSFVLGRSLTTTTTVVNWMDGDFITSLPPRIYAIIIPSSLARLTAFKLCCLWSLCFLKCFSQHDETSWNHKLVIIEFSDPFLYITYINNSWGNNRQCCLDCKRNS